MSTISATSAQLAAPSAQRVTSARVLRSEWIKFTSLRSTYWTVILILGSAVSFAGLMVLGLSLAPLDPATNPVDVITETFGARPGLGLIAFGLMLTQFVVPILGILIVSTERASGLMNVTLAAVPRRTPVLLSKLVVSAAAGFVIGVASSVVSFAIVQPSFGGYGFHAALWNADVAQSILGGAAYLALLSVLSTALASLFRSTASGAGAVYALLLVAPTVLSLVPGAGVVAQFLPTNAGMILSQPADVVGWGTLFAAFGIVAAWAAASSVVAAMLLKRRDA